MSKEDQEIISPARLKELKTAKKLIMSASKAEKQQLFSSSFGELKEYKTAFEQPENRMYPHSAWAIQANNQLFRYISRLTGYKLGWISDALARYSSNAGRNQKYDDMAQEVNCFFVAHMVKRGASVAQATKLLARLRGDISMTEGHLKGLRKTYNDYKALEHPSDHEEDLYQNGWKIAEFLAFSIEHLEGDELASKKAVEAFRDFWKELAGAMKALLPVIALRDNDYPDLFGNLIQWISEDYEDPLDYFYSHRSHSEDSIEDRKRWLREYINSIDAMMDR